MARGRVRFDKGGGQAQAERPAKANPVERVAIPGFGAMIAAETGDGGMDGGVGIGHDEKGIQVRNALSDGTLSPLPPLLTGSRTARTLLDMRSMDHTKPERTHFRVETDQKKTGRGRE
eukprot:11590715-Alexandrium_andersonii.AAC.1